jgi:glycerophosphoryl diester phosphodiesterase
MYSHSKKFEVISENMKTHAAKVAIEGHRGGKFAYDNTLSAFQLAIEHGLNSVEFDVWLTKDKIPIVIHGGLLGEIEHSVEEHGIKETDLINDLTLDQVKKIILPNGEQIPTLEEIILNFKDKIRFNCEVKEENPEFCQILIDMLVDHEIREGFVVSSFWKKQLDLISKLAKEEEIDLTIAFCYEFIDTMQPGEYLEDGDIITFDYKCLHKDIVDRIHAANKVAGIYFYPTTDETDSAYIKALEAGVDIIISDYPDNLKSKLDSIIKTNNN